MSTQSTLNSAIPAELAPSSTPTQQGAMQGGGYGAPTPTIDASSEDFTRATQKEREREIARYVKQWHSELHTARLDKQNIWTECWQLYRGLEDFRDKEEWQSKIVIPKAFNSVKQATSVIKRFLMASPTPFSLDPINQDDLIVVQRAEQMTELTRYFLEQAKYIEEFAEGLESGFITGVGIWKLWWGYTPRIVTQVVQELMDGRPMQQLVQQEILEGRLFIKAVDPYNFFWLPGSKLNRWVGTIEEVTLAKWELMDLAQKGLFDVEKVKNIPTNITGENDKYTYTRFSERPTTLAGPNSMTQPVRLRIYYGPLVFPDGRVEKDYHCMIANDDTVLIEQANPLWIKKPPYIGYSPLSLPFRTEGVGLVEMVRQIDKAMSGIANLSVDSLKYSLLPIFEVSPEIYENPEDFETGLTPGKIFRKKFQFAAAPGMEQKQFQDVSAGAMAVSGQLDRAHQEGALVSEIQQAIPRFRGYQSAQEIDIKNTNQQSFFSSMAADIEKQALAPMIEMANDLVFQFIDTAVDPRVASILGKGVKVLQGMTSEALHELVQGDYVVKATGISGQLERAEMLESLVQFMNIIGQNESWMPHINKQAFLRRVLEAFRPAIRDMSELVNDPATVQAEQAASQSQELTPEIISTMVQTIGMQLRNQQAQQQAQLQQMQMAHEAKLAELDIAQKEADIKLTLAKARGGGDSKQ